jgi:GTPase SAR1 family protein
LASPNAVILLVGNKMDIDHDRQITEEQANEFAQRHNMEYAESSAKLGEGIRELFVRLTAKILERVRTGEIPEVAPALTTPPVSMTAPDTKNEGCPC